MPHITYRPRADATPERERSALADVYRYVLTCPRRSERERRPAELRFPEDAAKEDKFQEKSPGE